MALVKVMKDRGATTVVEAHAEVLFTPSGTVGSWKRRLSNLVTARARSAAPTNKRPRWSHYGRPLKTTIKSKTSYHPSRMRIYSAVGSTSPYSYYVDQGTGIYAGGQPYQAKVLPPWHRGSASLYEHTWRPSGPGGRKVSPVYIKGQKGQFFLDKGVRAGFRSMRLRYINVPGNAGLISKVMDSAPSGLADFSGNTPADAAFVAQLDEWRSWRDEAWDLREGLGRGGGVGSRAHARFVEQATKQRQSRPKSTTKKPRAAVNKAKSTEKPKSTRGPMTLAERKDLAVAAFREKNPNVVIVGRNPLGLSIIAPNTGGEFTISWTRLLQMI